MKNFRNFILNFFSEFMTFFQIQFMSVFFSVDLKHVYFTINFHENDRLFFAFIIFGMKQLQFTRMFQGFKSVDFIMIEVINRVFEKILELNEQNAESFFLHFFNSLYSPNLCFYMDDFFDEQFKGFFFLYRYLRDHFLPRIEWTKLKLSFKKLVL